MADDIETLTRLVRSCVPVYRCVFRGRNCDIVFHTKDKMAQHLRIAHETEILNFYRIIRANFEREEMEQVDFRRYYWQAKQKLKTGYRSSVDIDHAFYRIGRIGRAMYKEEEMEVDIRNYLIHFDGTMSAEIRNLYYYIIGIIEEKLEGDFGTYLIRVARKCGTSYICVYCGRFFDTEDEMVGHLGGRHETEMLNTYNLLNGILAAVRRAMSGEEMGPDIHANVTKFVIRIEAKYRTLAGERRGFFDAERAIGDAYNDEEFIEEESIGHEITEKEMEEVDFDTYLIQVTRRCANRHRCKYCGKKFELEEEMVCHLGRAELDGGHETKIQARLVEEQARLLEEEQARLALSSHMFW